MQAIQQFVSLGVTVLAIAFGTPANAQTPDAGPNLLSIMSLSANVTGVAPVSDGSLIVVGTTDSGTFPTGSTGAGDYPFIAKLSSDRSHFTYTLLLRPKWVTITSIASDPLGNAYVTGVESIGNPAGTTDSVVNSPVTLQAGVCNCAFVLKLDTAGRVAYNALVGGIAAQKIVADNTGSAYVTGQGTAYYFPLTTPTTKSTPGVAVVKLNPAGTALIYATLFGSSGYDLPASVAVDPNGRAYIVGYTDSTDFPVTPGAFETTGRAGAGFAARLSTDGAHLEYSAYIIGASACTHGTTGAKMSIVANAAGEAYIAGCAESPDFPVTPGAYRSGRTPSPGLGATFVTKLNATGTALIYSALFGPEATYQSATFPIGIAVDGAGDAYFAGATFAPLTAVRAVEPSFPNTAQCPVYQTSIDGLKKTFLYNRACDQGFVAGLDPTGAKLIYSTHLTGGGTLQGDTIQAMALDTSGNLVIAGAAGSDLAALNPAAAGSGPSFITLLNPRVSPPFFTAGSITNGADFAAGGARERGIVSIFCSGLTGIAGTVKASGYPLPTQLAGVTVQVNATPAPLISIADLGGYQQINLQMPPDTANFGYSSIFVQQSGRVAAVTGLSPNFAAPGIFTQDGIHAIAQHSSDYSLVTPSNPAKPGEIVTLYVTGLGQVTPAIPVGVPAPLSPISTTTTKPDVLVQQQAATVLFSGAAPGMLGVDQLNIQLPAALTPGDLDLVVTLPNYAAWIPVETAGVFKAITPTSKTAKLTIGN